MQLSSACTITTPPARSAAFITPQITPSSESRFPDAEPSANVVNILNEAIPPLITSGSSPIAASVTFCVNMRWSA